MSSLRVDSKIAISVVDLSTGNHTEQKKLPGKQLESMIRNVDRYQFPFMRVLDLEMCRYLPFGQIESLKERTAALCHERFDVFACPFYGVFI